MLYKTSEQENISLTQANEYLSKLVAYASDQTHLAVEKAAKIIGVKLCVLPSDADFKLVEPIIQEAIVKDRADKLYPFFVCGTFGTTNTTAIDDLPGLANIAEAEDLWLHVDAAYARASLAYPEFRALAQGIERAQSISFSTNKWMLIHFGCLPLWVADSTYLIKALRVTHAYVSQNEVYQEGTKSDIKSVRNMRNWQTQLTRPFLALRVWCVLRMHGATGIRANIRTKVELAQWLDKKLRDDGRFEVIAPAVFGLVVFRVCPESLDYCLQSDVNRATMLLLQRIQADGQIFLTGTKVKGCSVIRVAIGSTFVKQDNIETLYQAIVQAAASIGIFSN
ncbi:hypothetical protein H4R22_000345 [Coemansia sp. RSA 1290]|nr:hypothetical protein H4R22_000345 [Coemansia sp. RSA 1290]